jgi:hypothetical protein
VPDTVLLNPFSRNPDDAHEGTETGAEQGPREGHREPAFCGAPRTANMHQRASYYIEGSQLYDAYWPHAEWARPLRQSRVLRGTKLFGGVPQNPATDWQGDSSKLLYGATGGRPFLRLSGNQKRTWHEFDFQWQDGSICRGRPVSLPVLWALAQRPRYLGPPKTPSGTVTKKKNVPFSLR